MYNAWLMDMRAQPPAIVARVQAKDRAILVASAQALARAFPESHFTLVHEVNAEPLHIAPPGALTEEEYDMAIESFKRSVSSMTRGEFDRRQGEKR